uniref:Uncharacterized protein n=1 Tax=Arundo donax TaxID=35708 RepID=A0A0A9FI85_ARUDO
MQNSASPMLSSLVNVSLSKSSILTGCIMFVMDRVSSSFHSGLIV